MTQDGGQGAGAGEGLGFWGEAALWAPCLVGALGIGGGTPGDSPSYGWSEAESLAAETEGRETGEGVRTVCLLPTAQPLTLRGRRGGQPSQEVPSLPHPYPTPTPTLTPTLTPTPSRRRDFSRSWSSHMTRGRVSSWRAALGGQALSQSPGGAQIPRAAAPAPAPQRSSLAFPGGRARAGAGVPGGGRSSAGLEDQMGLGQGTLATARG